MSIEELKDLVKFAREQGLTYIEYDGFKAQLGDLPFTPQPAIIDEDDADSEGPLPPADSRYRLELAKKQLKKDLFNL